MTLKFCQLGTVGIFKYGTFLWKNQAEIVHQKLVPDPVLIFVNGPKQPFNARNYFINKIL